MIRAWVLSLLLWLEAKLDKHYEKEVISAEQLEAESWRDMMWSLQQQHNVDLAAWNDQFCGGWPS